MPTDTHEEKRAAVRRVLALVLVCAAGSISACAPSAAACVVGDAGPTADVGPKPLDSFTACDTFDDLVARNADRWGCGTALPECPWPRALDVRCDAGAVLETLSVARASVTECAGVLPAIDPDACR